MRLLTLLLAGTIGLFACSGDEGPSEPGNGPPAGITVGDNFFNPSNFSATVGTPVVWTWTGSLEHNVTFDDQPPSATQSSGTFSRTFTAAGTFDYFCSVHGPQQMSGVVTVAASSSSGGSGGGGSGGGGSGGGGGYDGY